ncbi:hypothetical protein [Geminicoccus flavidas]|uniref:hypothetical protein n=1 Tax=Geminicoccus flavidas TaxID=2506407 RepID=UPI0013585135|nr:hypothetical protein [Geminicoccus flavidas]
MIRTGLASAALLGVLGGAAGGARAMDGMIYLDAANTYAGTAAVNATIDQYRKCIEVRQAAEALGDAADWQSVADACPHDSSQADPGKDVQGRGGWPGARLGLTGRRTTAEPVPAASSPRGCYGPAASRAACLSMMQANATRWRSARVLA